MCCVGVPERNTDDRKLSWWSIREGHEPDITQVGTACAAEVGVQKPDQHVVRIVVAGIPTPPFEDAL